MDYANALNVERFCISLSDSCCFLNVFVVVVQAIYYNYNGDHSKALEQFLQCAYWQKAHTIFVTSVAHRLFLQCKLCVYLAW